MDTLRLVANTCIRFSQEKCSQPVDADDMTRRRRRLKPKGLSASELHLSYTKRLTHQHIVSRIAAQLLQL